MPAAERLSLRKQKLKTADAVLMAAGTMCMGDVAAQLALQCELGTLQHWAGSTVLVEHEGARILLPSLCSHANKVGVVESGWLVRSGLNVKLLMLFDGLAHGRWMQH